MNDTKALALELAKIGWYVFPCGKDKKPLCKWKEIATCDPDAIEAMAWPGLVGIYCQKSGFFAIDLDRKNGADGLATWTRWVEQNGQAITGPIQQSPHGAHALFKLPENLPIPNKAGLFPGVDLRSEGYICTGAGYKWLRPIDTPIPDAPGWLLEKIKNAKPEKPYAETVKEITTQYSGANNSPAYWLEKFLPQAAIGRRNENGFNLACQVRDAGYSQAEAEALPYPERCPQGQDVYSREEWEATVKSAFDRTPREPAKKQGGIITSTNPVPVIPEPEAPPDFPEEAPPEAPGEAQPMEATKRPRYILRDAAYALQPQPPIDYIVDALITNSSVNVFYGEPGSKKTYTALSLAVCVGNGKPWLDFKTRKAPVLIIDEESGERRFTRRLGEAIRGELCDITSPIYYVSLAGFKLDDLNDPVLIQALIEKTGAKLVIFDALADLMDGDENSKQDTQPVFNALRKMAEATDSAILIIHHSNKQGGYRGSSAIKGSVDLMVQVTSENGSPYINFQSEKNRDGEKAGWAAKATWTADQFYLRPADTKEKIKVLSKSQEYVIRYLTEHGASPLPAIMGAADTCSDNAAKLAVYKLADLGKVRRTNPGTRPAIYELTEKENQND